MATIHLRRGDAQVVVDRKATVDVQRVWIAQSTKATAMDGWVVRTFEDYDGNSYVPVTFDVFLSQQSAMNSVLDHAWDVTPNPNR